MGVGSGVGVWEGGLSHIWWLLWRFCRLGELCSVELPLQGGGGLLVGGEGAAVPPLLRVFCRGVVRWWCEESGICLAFCGRSRLTERGREACVVHFPLEIG